MPERDTVRELADAVAEGRIVAWPSAVSGLGQEELELITELRVIAELARVHRSSAKGSSLGALSSSVDGSEPPPTGTPSEAVWGPLRVLERLGSGSFGEVFRAWDPSLDREVALKLLRPRTVASDRVADAVVREGQMLAKVQHPNVMAV
jgi:hypothetical protein